MTLSTSFGRPPTRAALEWRRSRQHRRSRILETVISHSLQVRREVSRFEIFLFRDKHVTEKRLTHSGRVLYIKSGMTISRPGSATGRMHDQINIAQNLNRVTGPWA